MFYTHLATFCSTAMSPLVAEISALMEGVALTVQHIKASSIVQSNCSVALNAMVDHSLDSCYGHVMNAIKVTLEDREFIIQKLD